MSCLKLNEEKKGLEVPEFRQFNVTFHESGMDYYNQTTEEKLNRIYARSIIRGMLMFNDFELSEDPWDYNLKKNLWLKYSELF